MSGPWDTLGAVAPEDLVDATLELHWAAQILAAAGQALVAPRDDDSHRAMTWDPVLRALVGSGFAGPYPFRLALRPENLTLALLDRGDQVLGSLPLGGRTTADALDWVRSGLATYLGRLPDALVLPDYDMPAHAVGRGAPFRSGRDAERRVLTALYASAASLLSELISTRSDASPVTCWPHHFDIATLITLERGAGGAATKTVGVGLAPMGGGYGTWYWYVSPWPYPPVEGLPTLMGPGSWHSEGWTGAVLTSAELLAGPEAFREAIVRKFLDVSVEAAVGVLAG